MSGMFYNCSNLTELDLSKFDTKNVKYMNNMFEGCSSLISLDLKNFNTSEVTDITNLFKGCFSLEFIDLSGFKTHSLKEYSGAFNNISEFGKIILNFEDFEMEILGELINKWNLTNWIN